MNRGKKETVSCYHNDCLLSFKTLKQRSLHHKKTENECNDETLALLTLIKVYHKTLLSISLVANEKIDIEKNNKYIGIKKEHVELSEKYLERGNDNFSTLLTEIVEVFPKIKEE